MIQNSYVKREKNKAEKLSEIYKICHHCKCVNEPKYFYTCFNKCEKEKLTNL